LVASLITALSMAALAGGAAVVLRKARIRESAAEQDYPPEGQIVMVADRRVHALVMGQGPDLVLIHGASGNLRDFTFGFAQRMAQDYRVIAFDRPGLGYTDRSHKGHDAAFATTAESPGEQAGVLAAAAALLGADRPIVLGHSYGGAVALAWALDHPCAAVVSLAGVAMPWPDKLDPFYRVSGSALGGAVVLPLIAAFAGQAQVDAAMASIFAPQPVPPGYGAHVGAALTIRRGALRANARQVNTLLPHVTAMAARYPGLHLPVELLHGDADVIVPLSIHAGPASRILPDANLTVLPRVGHMPHHVDPDSAADAVHRAAAKAGLR